MNAVRASKQRELHANGLMAAEQLHGPKPQSKSGPGRAGRFLAPVWAELEGFSLQFAAGASKAHRLALRGEQVESTALLSKAEGISPSSGLSVQKVWSTRPGCNLRLREGRGSG